MDTIIKKLDDIGIDHIDETFMEIGEVLKNGGLVAFPTETVYGLGANALDENAAKKIYEAKGRPSDNPLIIHISNIKDLEVVASDITDTAQKLAEVFWPGPLTMVLNKTPLVPYATSGGLETVAVRFPSNEPARRIITAAGGFVAAPSANSSGKPSPTTAGHVINDLMGKIDMIVDGGPCDIGLESTIVDLTTEVPTILRPGSITKNMLEEVIGRVEKASDEVSDTQSPKAPGMKYRHYAPKAELSIFVGRTKNVADRINIMARECLENSKLVGIICSNETKELYENGIVQEIGSLSDSNDIAAHLYDILRDFDARGVDYIFSESFFVGELGDAIMNRLEKAAGGKIFICSANIDYDNIETVIFVDNDDVSLSVMAKEIALKKRTKENLNILSRGLNVLFSEPANQKTQIVLENHKLDGKNHLARRLKQIDFSEKTAIVALNIAVKDKIMDRFENTEQLYTISEFFDERVVLEDPFGKDIEEYEKCYIILDTILTKAQVLIL